MKKSVSIIGTRGYPSFYGGFETAVRRLAPYLGQLEWDVRVYSRPGHVTGRDEGVNPSVKSVTTWGIDRRSLSTLSYGLSSCLHALRHPTDVALVMNCANGFWLPLLRLRGIRIVVNVDGIEWERAKWGPLARWTFKTGARLTARFADQLVFDAKAIALYWQAEFGRSGVFIPYGGDPSEGTEGQTEFADRPYVLLVARFVPENSIEEFFEAVPRVTEFADVVLVGSDGDGVFDSAARRLAESTPGVHWLGHLSDDDRLHSLWQNSAVYFHGHSVGGTNPALVQAMALGANVVARDTPYNREVLEDAGRYCRPEASHIVATLAEALTAPRDSVAVAERARRHYSWEGVCRAYAKTLEDELVAGRSTKSLNQTEHHATEQSRDRN